MIIVSLANFTWYNDTCLDNLNNIQTSLEKRITLKISFWKILDSQTLMVGKSILNIVVCIDTKVCSFSLND